MNPIDLNEVQINDIRQLAYQKRLSLGYTGETPIAKDIFTTLDRLNIILLEYPVKSDTDKPAFAAAIMYSEEGNQKLTFIGLNTADYYDKQIFAIAHELYHYYTKAGSHLSRPEDEENNLIETQANRFAAEFLLPKAVLESMILDQFNTSSLKDIQNKTLLRFIARLHCTWWLPYRSLVKRLLEIEAITSDQYDYFYTINERDLVGMYGKIGQAINKEIFLRLNQPTNNTGTSPKQIEMIIKNFEDDLIDEDKFIEILNLFDRTPEEFGFEIEVSQDDLDEMENFFNGENDNEG